MPDTNFVSIGGARRRSGHGEEPTARDVAEAGPRES